MGNHCFQSAVPPNWFLAVHEGRVFLEPFFTDSYCKLHLDKHSHHYVIRNHNFHYLAASANGQLYVHNTHNHFDCKFKLEQAPQFGGKYMFQSYHGSYLGIRNGVIGCFMDFGPCETWNIINNFTGLPKPNGVVVGTPMMTAPMAAPMAAPMMAPAYGGYGGGYGGGYAGGYAAPPPVYVPPAPVYVPPAYPQPMMPGMYPAAPPPVYQINMYPPVYPAAYPGAPGTYPYTTF